VQQPASADPKDPNSVVWVAANLPPTARSVVFGKGTRGGSKDVGPLRAGTYRVTTCVYDKVKQSSDWSGLVGVGIQLLTVKALVRTQIQIGDIRPDGTIHFRSIQQRINRSDQPIRTRGFRNSDFVRLSSMTDAKGRPIKFTSTHQGGHYRYLATLNELVPPGRAILMSSGGTMTGLVKPVAGAKGEFRHHMRHWPAGGEPTRRIEVYRLPTGAELLDTTPANMARRERDGRIELCVQERIPLGGSITTAFRYRLIGQGD
jgi:hypothetical protein